MNIVALVKCVPDTETKIKIGGDGASIDENGIKWVMNPYDEFAVEEALKLKEQLGDATVTVVSMGPDRVVETLRTALAMGADNAMHVSDPAFEGGDSQANGKVLAHAIKGLDPKLILCGKQGIDDDAAQTASAIAEALGAGQASVVINLEVNGDSAVATRRVEGGDEIVEMTLPAVVTCEKGLNEPRYASLPGIMKAKKKEIQKITLADTGLSADEVGAAGASSRIVSYQPLPERPPVKMIEGDVDAQAKELVRLLREEAKVI